MKSYAIGIMNPVQCSALMWNRMKIAPAEIGIYKNTPSEVLAEEWFG